MNKLDAITEAYLLATGKASPPAEGTTKRSSLAALAVKFNRDWQIEPDVEWDSLYDWVGAGKAKATDTYELDEEINFISTDGQREENYVYILTLDGQKIGFKTVRPRDLKRYPHGNAVAKISENRIKFSRVFTADEQAFGGSIFVPAITKLDDLENDDDDVLIDDPLWLPARMAAQFVLPNSQLNYLYEDLLDQANEKMEAMIDRNTSGNETTSTGVDYFNTTGAAGSDR